MSEAKRKVEREAFQQLAAIQDATFEGGEGLSEATYDHVQHRGSRRDVEPHRVDESVTRWRSQFRVRALNARIQSTRRTPLIGTCRNKAAQPRTTAIVV
jgi:hypothetical protein